MMAAGRGGGPCRLIETGVDSSPEPALSKANGAQNDRLGGRLWETLLSEGDSNDLASTLQSSISGAAAPGGVSQNPAINQLPFI